MSWQWHAFLVSFATIFIAELGDKTQLATLSFASRGMPPASVFAGSALALVAAAGLGTLAGAALSQFISERVLTTVAGAFFIVMGILMLLRKI